MSGTPYTLWCYVEGDKPVFPVTASSSTSIGALKDLIQDKCKHCVLNSVDAKDLAIWKVCYF
jgi:hypothetical protein